MPEKGKSTLAIRICRQCGIEFMGGPRAWYCPSCRAKRAREQDRIYKQKARTYGVDRPIGSVDKCVVCGAEYVVQSWRQKYCKRCATEASRAVDREQSKDWLKKAIERHGEEYYKKHLERKRQWANQHQPIKEATICPMCGHIVKRGYTYCCEKCKNAGTRYGYAKYKFKIGKLKTEPKFSDYQKGGRLYGNKNR